MSKRILAGLIVLIFVFMAAGGTQWEQAAEHENKKLSLEEAIDLAYEKNNDILKAAKERKNKLESNTGAVSWICPFTTKNKKCSIYNIRPKTCREFHCKPTLNTFNKDEIQFKKHYTIKDLL